MDMDFPDRFVVHRVSKRPPSIHAALNPDIESRDFRRSDPDLQQLKSSYDVINEKNRMLENQINEMRYQLSDSNKLLLKVQEEKESDKLKFLGMLNKINNKNGPTRNLENGDTLTKYFSLEMSSNRTSEADLQKPSIPESIDPSIYHQFTESRIQELKLDEIKTQTLKSEALMRLCKVRQKDDQIFTLKSLNENLKSELRDYKQLDEQSKAEIIQYKQKRKEYEEQLRTLRNEKGQDKVEIRRLKSENEELKEKNEMLEFKITNYKDEIDNVRENYESLRADFEEMKKENEFLKKANISLEKENHILQNNMDKVNRLFEKASAESVRYKSVVDLQKSALTELQRDLNRTTIDYVPNGSLVSDMMPVISYKNNSRLLQTAKSADYEKDIFDTNNFDPKIDHINPYVKEISDLGDFKPLQKKSLQNSPNRNLVAYYSSRDAKKRFQNLSNHIFDSNRENQSHLLNKGKLLMERTFDHTTNLYNLSESKHISLTEDNISKPRKGIINYAPKQHPLMGEALQKKRASTEQLMHVSPGNSSPEVTTEKTESFVSTSTIINPPDLHDSDFRNKHKQDLVARAMSRRESRVLIQPLPRLFTKSKYEGFRQAKSSERREYNSSRDNLLTATTKYFSPKETNDRDSMNQKHDIGDKSHLEVPHHCENSGCRL